MKTDELRQLLKQVQYIKDKPGVNITFQDWGPILTELLRYREGQEGCWCYQRKRGGKNDWVREFNFCPLCGKQLKGGQ